MSSLFKHIGELIIVVSLSMSMAGQDIITAVKSDLIPPTPQSRQYMECQTPKPSLLTGASEFSIPIYTINSDNYSLPVTLRYHSNGVKVMDDATPVGFGWSLLPALRATRTIMGRPDELFQFMGDSFQTGNNKDLAYECMVNQFAESRINTGRYDSQHDIISFALPFYTITRIINMTDDGPEFVGNDMEYRVTSDNTLDTITVTAPDGVRYIFGSPNEYQPSDSYYPGQLRTAWALVRIELTSGRNINMEWSLEAHPGIERNYIGGTSFMDGADKRLLKDYRFDDYLNSGYDNGVLTPMGNCQQYLMLRSITFPGGKLTFSYSFEILGPMLTNVDVRDSAGVNVWNVKLRYNEHEISPFLLESIELPGNELYSFEYYTPKFYNNIHSQDWWGYYNAKENESLTPKVKIRSKPTSEAVDSVYTRELGEADRSVDTTAMLSNMLREVCYPSGGTATFEYEPHHFVPQRMETGGEIHPEYDPYLSVGGGVRVSAVTMSADSSDTHQVRIEYRYPNATVRSVPSMATFINTCTAEIPKTTVDGPIWYTTQMRMVNILPQSDYMRFDTGEIPLWYHEVEEIYPEGKTVYCFGRPSSNIANVINVSYGKRIISNLARALSKGPQLVSKKTYRESAGLYTLVESDSMEYVNRQYHVTLPSTHILREIINPGTANTTLSAPDFDDGDYLYNVFLLLPTYHVNIEPYLCCPYGIIPCTEELIRKSHTEYTETGEYTTCETFTYLQGTGLCTSSSKTSSDGVDRITTVSYPGNDSFGTERQMYEANVLCPIMAEVSHGNNVLHTKAEYARYGQRAFRKHKIKTWHNSLSDTVISPEYKYNSLGNLIQVVDRDSIASAILWGYNGLYATHQVSGVDIAALKAVGLDTDSNNSQSTEIPESVDALTTMVSYIPLVGVASITDPAGITDSFLYDSAHRLVSSSSSNLGVTASYRYTLSKNEPDSVVTTVFLNADGSTGHPTADIYDGIGRQLMQKDLTSGIASHFRYDSMGRKMAVSMPSKSSPGTYDWETIAYEPSPRGIVSMKNLAGELWQSEEHASHQRLLTNTSSGAYSCPRYRMTAGGDIECLGNYPAGTLLIKESVDEDGMTTITFTDMSGLKIMERNVADINGELSDSWLDTKYVYDGFDRVCCILPPAIEGSHSSDSSYIANFAFIYSYDSANRIVSEKIPGCVPVKYVYSPGGRLVAKTVPYQSGKWLVFYYDNKGREILKALAPLQQSHVEMLSYMLPRGSLTDDGPYGGYALSQIPVGVTLSPLKATYYDAYSFPHDTSLGFHYDLDNQGMYLQHPKGLITGEHDFAYGPSQSSTVLYYGLNGRMIQQAKTTLKGVVRQSFQYSYAGELIKEHLTLDGDTGRIVDRTTSHTFDNAQRLVRSSVLHNGNSASMSLSYNSNGLVDTIAYGNRTQQIKKYDIHRWLSSSTIRIPKFRPIISDSLINDTLINLSPGLSSGFYSGISSSGASTFAVLPPTTPIVNNNIYYTYSDKLLYANGDSPRYNGTPSARITSLGGRYDYHYDGFDRLISAEYTAPGSNPNEDFSTAYSYNAMGSPVAISRFGVTEFEDGNETFGLLDSMTLDYDGNRLSSVTHQGAGSDFFGRTGYPHCGEAETFSYSSNQAGALSSDAARGISSISYDHNGRPILIEFTSGNRLIFQRDADGLVLHVEALTAIYPAGNMSQSASRYYVAGMVMEGDSIMYAPFKAGYFDHCGKPHYYHTDYQGSVTMVTGPSGDIEQHNGYYPYGEPWRESSGQPWQFSAKERFRLGAMNDYMFGARVYNPATINWDSNDREAYKYSDLSPRSYCAANPIRNIDPSGNDIVILGKKASSITIKTDLFNYKGDASFFGINWGGKYVLQGDEVLSAALDIVGFIDPTGIADGLNAT
ncbi:MAG: RHS repeat domain-containing protein, partial [Muribaculaceae bacterium]